MNLRYEEKVVLITGVSDRGIGAAVAERLSSEGAAVALMWHQRPARLIRRLERNGRAFIDGWCDVTDPASVAAAVDACMSEFGQIDVLVNNAGVETVTSLGDLADDDWMRQLEVNLSGAMRMTRAVLPWLSEPGGVVMGISSVLGMAGCAGYPAYAASKAGLIGMMKALAAELAPRGQRALCVAPAVVHTPMVHKYVDSLTPEMEQQLASCHPLGLGTVHDVANAVAFLASDEARWITGVTLPLGWMENFPLPVSPILEMTSACDSTCKPVGGPNGREPSSAEKAKAAEETIPLPRRETVAPSRASAQ